MQRLEQQARTDGRSVAGLIRDAIDIAYPPVDATRRRRAVEQILAAPPMPVEDWPQMKATDRDTLYGESNEHA